MSRPVTRERGYGEEEAGVPPVATMDNPEAEGEAANKCCAYEGLSTSLKQPWRRQNENVTQYLIPEYYKVIARSWQQQPGMARRCQATGQAEAGDLYELKVSRVSFQHRQG